MEHDTFSTLLEDIHGLVGKLGNYLAANFKDY